MIAKPLNESFYAPVESVQIEPAERPDARILKAIIVSTIISVAVSVICFVCFKK